MSRRPPAAACRGLTLLEMMIGLVITFLLVAFGTGNYVSWVGNSQIRTAADALRDGLQLARAEAVRRNTQVALTLNGNDWTVATVSPAATIESRSNLDGSPNAQVTASTTSLTFTALGQLSPAANVTFSVSNPKAGSCVAAGGALHCLNLTVSAGGAIRMCDPALPASNAQSCQATS